MELLLLIAIVVLAVQISGLKRRVRELEGRVSKQAGVSRTAEALSHPAAGATAPAAMPAVNQVPAPVLRDASQHESDEGFIETQPGELAVPSRPVDAKPPVSSPVREPAMYDRDMREWPLVQLLKQNLFAVAGVCLLLLGFTFLFRSIEWGQLLPPWARIGLAYVATAGLAWAGVRLSGKRPLWAQIAQGGAAAVAYLATYIAATRFGLFSDGVAMALFAGISFLLVARSLVEDSKVLAAIGFLGAYAAPMLALDRGGPLSFNLFYGLLVTAFALWISYRRRWIEIALHAHLCAAGLAALTYRTRAEPLQPWLQQGLLHAYLVQLLLWCVAWSRRWLSADEPSRRADAATAVPIACLCAAVLCYLAMQSWLMPQWLSFVAGASAAVLAAMGFTVFRDRKPLQETAWVLAGLSAVVGFSQADLSDVFKGLGLLLEGLFLMLTVQRPGSLRAWLGRLLVGVGALILLSTGNAWAQLVLLLATMAMALEGRRRANEASAHVLDGLDSILFAAWSVAGLGAMTGEFMKHEPVPWLILFTALSALQAAVALWRRGASSHAAMVFLVVTGASWVALAALPDRSRPELQLLVLAGILVAGVALARRHLPRRNVVLSAAVAGVGSLLLCLLPAVFAYKLSANLAVLASVVALGLAASVWAVRRRIVARLWQLEDDAALLELATPMAHVLAAAAVALWFGLPLTSGASAVTLSLTAFLACLATWVLHGTSVDEGIRRVLGTCFALVGVFSWSMAVVEGNTQGVLRLTLSSQLLPVLLTAVAVAFLFHASRAGLRLTWGAAAAVCAASSVKLLMSLGSALLSPLGVAASLLGMGALLLLAGYLAPLPPEEGTQAG